MRRISDISSPEDFAIEAQREDLRDRSWRRYRNMIMAIAPLLTLLLTALKSL